MDGESNMEAHITNSLLDQQNSDRRSVNGASSFTAIVVLSTFVAVAGSYVFGSAVGYSSPAESGIMDDLGLSLAEYSVFGSALTFGAMIGAIITGKLADMFGRRGTMAFAELFCILGLLAIVYSKAAWSLDLGRLLLGCGIGITSYVVPVYITEITPTNLRGGFATVHQFMICLGSAVTYLVGTLVTWRTLAAIGLIPCFVQILGLLFIPESPRWLAKNGRDKEFEASLQRLRGENADVSQELAEIREYMEMVQLSETRFLELFQWQYARSLTVGVGLMVLRQFGGSDGVTFYASAIFAAADFPSKAGTLALALIQMPATTTGILLMDKSGRRPLLMVSAAGSCFGFLLAGLSFLLQDLQELNNFTPSLVLVGLLIYYASYTLGLGGIPWVLMSEIYPIDIKGSAGSLVTLANWFSSWIVSYVFNFMLDWSTAGTFFIFAGICGITLIFVAKLVPETKGKTIEEIQAETNPIIVRG